jgi:hypothetical protein
MEILELDKLKNRDWQLFKISALKNSGVKDVFKWVSKTISKDNSEYIDINDSSEQFDSKQVEIKEVRYIFIYK